MEYRNVCCFRSRWAVAAATACVALAYLGYGRASVADEPAARPLRFAIGLGGGYGYASLERFNTMVRDVEAAVERGTGVSVEGADDVHGIAWAGLSVRGWLPYYIAAEIGFGTMYASDDAVWRVGPVSGELEHNELGFEIPVLVGGYYPFLGQIFVTGLLGLNVLVGPMSLWDQSGGADLNDYDADGGIGFMAVLGIDWLPAEHFALGLDVRYRYLVSDSLKYDTDGAGDGTIVQSGHLRGDGTTETYDLSFSGVSVQAMVKLVI